MPLFPLHPSAFTLQSLFRFLRAGFSFAQKEDLGISLAPEQSYDGINSANDIASDQDGDRPGQHDPRAIFPVDDPANEEKEADVNVEEGNDPPGVVHQLAPVLQEITNDESVGQSSPHDEGQDDKVNEGKILTHQSSASRCLGSG